MDFELFMRSLIVSSILCVVCITTGYAQFSPSPGVTPDPAFNTTAPTLAPTLVPSPPPTTLQPSTPEPTEAPTFGPTPNPITPPPPTTSQPTTLQPMTPVPETREPVTPLPTTMNPITPTPGSVTPIPSETPKPTENPTIGPTVSPATFRPTESPNTPVPTSVKAALRTGAIIGIVMGSIAVIAAVGIVAIHLRRKRSFRLSSDQMYQARSYGGTQTVINTYTQPFIGNEILLTPEEIQEAMELYDTRSTDLFKEVSYMKRVLYQAAMSSTPIPVSILKDIKRFMGQH